MFPETHLPQQHPPLLISPLVCPGTPTKFPSALTGMTSGQLNNRHQTDPTISTLWNHERPVVRAWLTSNTCWAWLLTSAGVVFHEELIQGHPPSANTDHHGAAQDADQPQLLGVPELQGQGHRWARALGGRAGRYAPNGADCIQMEWQVRSLGWILTLTLLHFSQKT